MELISLNLGQVTRTIPELIPRSQNYRITLTFPRNSARKRTTVFQLYLILQFWSNSTLNLRLRFLADFNEVIRLRERNYEEPEEKANKVDKIPVNPDACVNKDGTEYIPHNVMSQADLRHEMFCDKEVIQQVL
ncbi:hypothetical protein TNCV_3131181 [Trichonephila clavipes]|nr:hypothetical protein TNCV_3131181 [Trichonephila clavipes]